MVSALVITVAPFPMAAQRAVYYFRAACKTWQEHAAACARALLNLTATQPDLSPLGFR